MNANQEPNSMIKFLNYGAHNFWRIQDPNIDPSNLTPIRINAKSPIPPLEPEPMAKDERGAVAE
jgi:hypothetical protein